MTIETPAALALAAGGRPNGSAGASFSRNEKLRKRGRLDLRKSVVNYLK
jgi:hypothetical protein